ncbi:hypothetical protein MMC31_001341 [Peltigera leucophlebia]|nr:hypothetical protein [Peltigera leucophlebia]
MQFVSEPQTGISSPNPQVTTPEPQKTDIFDVPASGVEGVTKHLLNNILLCEDRSVVPPRQFTCPPGVAPGTTFPADPNSPGTPLNSPDNNNSDNNWSAGSSVPTTNGNWRA